MTATISIGRAAILGAICVVLPGCALTSKSAPVEFRYFTPETLTTPGPAPPLATTSDAGKHLEVRLGSINGASYLRDRIAFRNDRHELGYYEELRWTEKPEVYVRRAVERALFEVQGVQELISKPGPTLEIDLDAFEELLTPRHVARVEITWSLRDEQAVMLRRTFAVERPIAPVKIGNSPDAIVSAMTAALREAVSAVVEGAVGELAREQLPQH